MDAVQHVPDTITITEYHFLDIASKGADIECMMSTWFRFGSPTTPIVRLKADLSLIKIPEANVSITNFTNDNNIFGCVTALVIAAFAGACVGVDKTWINPLPLIQVISILATAVVILLLTWTFVRGHTYKFKIYCENNDSVDHVLSMLQRKYSDINVWSTSWRYEVNTENLGTWAERCIERANVRANRVAKSLGVQIAGVFAYEEKHDLPDRTYSPNAKGITLSDNENSGPAMSRVQRASADNTGGSGHVGQSKGESRAGAHVRVQYRVANYTPPSAM